MIHDVENYEIVPLTEEEEGIIEEKIMEYADALRVIEMLYNTAEVFGFQFKMYTTKWS